MIDIPDGLAYVLGAGILALQAVVVALIGFATARLARIKRDTAAARDQLENDHRNPDGTVINMRDENDRRHDETKKWLSDIRKDIGGLRAENRDDRAGVERRFQAVERRVDDVASQVNAVDGQVDELRLTAEKHHPTKKETP